MQSYERPGLQLLLFLGGLYSMSKSDRGAWTLACGKADLLTSPGLGCDLWGFVELQVLAVHCWLLWELSRERKREGPWSGKQELSWNAEVWVGPCALGPATAPQQTSLPLSEVQGWGGAQGSFHCDRCWVSALSLT